jgi:hypothetical protein
MNQAGPASVFLEEGSRSLREVTAMMMLDHAIAMLRAMWNRMFPTMPMM